MAPFTEFFVAVVAHSSAAALSHFGVVIEPPKVERVQPAPQKVIARSPRKPSPQKLADCPDTRAAPRATAWKA